MENNQKSEIRKEWAKAIVMLSLTTLRCAIGYTLLVGGAGFAEPGWWLLMKFTGSTVYGGDSAFIDMLVTIVGYLIISGPMILRIFRGGLLSAFNPQSYVVITTYSDGSKESDYGEESNTLDAFNFIFRLVGGVFLASLATLVFVVVRWGYFIGKCFIGKDKAPFFAVIPIALVFVAWFVCAPLASLQMKPFFNPQRYDTKVMTETVADAKNFLSANSYSYKATVIPVKKRKSFRHKYEATVTYNKARETTVVEIIPENERVYLLYFDLEKNKVVPGTYTFRDGDLIESKPATAANRMDVKDRTMTAEGIAELKQLFSLPAETIDQMEKLVAAQSESSAGFLAAKSLGDIVTQMVKVVRSQSGRETLWGFVNMYATDYTEEYRRQHTLKGIEAEASREVNLYYQPWLHGKQWKSMKCYTVKGKGRLYRLSGSAGGKRFRIDEISYN